MSFLNNIKIELFIFLVILLSIFISFGLDGFVYNLVQSFDGASGIVYLKLFFIKITELGSSAWYFGISSFFLIILLINKNLNLIKINNLNNKVNFFISSIIYLIAIGLITQIAKHIVGRPRPNYTEFENPYLFNYFTFESNFHSFPSGHSSTIFMVFLILSAVLPKLKYYFFIFASIIALSRIIVGAHFITDVVAGGLLALIVYKFLNYFFQKKNENFIVKKTNLNNNDHLVHLIIILLGLGLMLSIGPTLDIFVAGIFYYGDSQFYLQSFHILSILFRDILIPCLLIYVLILPIVGKFINTDIIFFRYNFEIKEILLIWFSQFLSILVFVNIILKNFWGRARPGEIMEFGGVETFTPWYEISTSCHTNCSFVSGDASVGFGIIVLYLITRNTIYFYLSLVFGFLLGFIRILAGGHFLSDIVFSCIFIIILNLFIFKIYKKYYAK